MDVEDIIRCIKEGDEDGIWVQLQHFNREYAQCFFFDEEEQERRRRQELEQFKKNKVRDYLPDSDSDYDEKAEDPDVILRLNLAAVLTQYIRSDPPGRVLRACLQTLRILSRDKKILGPLVTDNSLLILAKLGGVNSGVPSRDDEDDPENPYASILEALAEVRRSDDHGHRSADGDVDDGNEDDYEPHSSAEGSGDSAQDDGTDPEGDEYTGYGAHYGRVDSNTTHACVGGQPRGSIQKMLARGKKDNRMSIAPVAGDEEEGEASEDIQRKEAMKVLCNVVYNSVWAQERASELRLLSGVTEALGSEARSLSPHCGQFYELRFMFLLTALRPELRTQLKQEGGVPLLTALLEQCLEVQWGEQNHVLPRVPPVPPEASQRAMEALKTLFNITHSAHTQEPSEEDSALYRHLAVILGHCLMVTCEGEKETDDLRGHTVNLLSALPLSCLDVLATVPLSPNSEQWEGLNMDGVHSLLLYMERKLEKGHKVKEKLTPVLNFLTEISRAHRQTRRYLRQQILPPLRDVSLRPEHGTTLKSRLVRLMTHVDTELKHCAADLLFILCKENVGRFVKYTGYGNAAGLLATRGLLGGQSKSSVVTAYYSSDSDSDTEEYRQAKDRVNLVTGRVEEEQPDPMQGMTEEEKEEEARRLVSLFSKLSRENVIQPMGLNAEGRLTPMSGLMTDPMAEENDQENGGVDDLEDVE
ncbi:synembryn-A [Alosa sapidissima]|uniref:synembryn-A n=1 Tax=Alosa sapidissima TaxID=34773 RepID=UPI001C09E27B|nr:synembryn-A [Alosa sapidissima]XP_041938297.1 synembryn-A [Alosa sapidissima]